MTSCNISLWDSYPDTVATKKNAAQIPAAFPFSFWIQFFVDPLDNIHSSKLFINQCQQSSSFSKRCKFFKLFKDDFVKLVIVKLPKVLHLYRPAGRPTFLPLGSAFAPSSIKDYFCRFQSIFVCRFGILRYPPLPGAQESNFLAPIAGILPAFLACR